MKTFDLIKKNRLNKLKNKFYIKYFMIQSGNDNPILKKDINLILSKLEKLLN